MDLLRRTGPCRHGAFTYRQIAAQAFAERHPFWPDRQGQFTGVEGEDVVFGPGDMVLTPNDAWHNHGTVGGEQAVNLSVLDLPLVETLHAVHFDHRYTEMVDGKEVEKKVHARFPADYSQRI